MQLLSTPPSERWPAWMRQPRQTTDWGLLIAAALGLMAAWTFILRPGVPAFSDLLYTAHMTGDIADAMREGQLVAQWSPHVFGGYGAPVPSFIPHGAAWLTAVIEVLLTGSTETAVRMAVAGSLITASAGMYLLVRRWLNAPSGVLAAALYVFSPYLGLTAPHIVGDLPALMAAAVCPLALWRASRLGENESRWDLPLTAVALAAMLFIHPPLTICTTILALVLNLPKGSRAVQKQVTAAACALGLFAPFWVPYISEIGLVTWREGTVAPDLLALSGLFTPARAADPGLLNPPPQFTLGVILPAFALAGLAFTVIRERERTFAALMLAGLIGGLAAALSFPAWTWLTVILTLCCAALGGVALRWREVLPAWMRRGVLPVTLGLYLAASSPVWLSPHGPVHTDFSPLAQVEFERQGFGVAVVPAGQSVPTMLPVTLAPDRGLIDSYRTPPLSRVPRGTAARVTPIALGTHGSTWQVSASVPQQITLLLAYHPGWEADLDGMRLVTEADPVSRLVSVRVPRTSGGTLRISLNMTAERANAWLIVVGTVVGMTLWVRLSVPGEPRAVNPLSVQEARLVAFALVFAAVFIALSVLPGSANSLRPDALYSLRGTRALTAQSPEARLTNYQLSATRLEPGAHLTVTLYWAANAVSSGNAQARLVLVDIDRQTRYLLSNLMPPGGVPMGRWLLGYTVTDTRTVVVPDDLIPGTYQISVEVFPCPAACTLSQPLRFTDSQGVSRPFIRLPEVLTYATED